MPEIPQVRITFDIAQKGMSCDDFHICWGQREALGSHSTSCHKGAAGAMRHRPRGLCQGSVQMVLLRLLWRSSHPQTSRSADAISRPPRTLFAVLLISANHGLLIGHVLSSKAACVFRVPSAVLVLSDSSGIWKMPATQSVPQPMIGIETDGFSAILVETAFGAGFPTPPLGPTDGRIFNSQQTWRRTCKRLERKDRQRCQRLIMSPRLLSTNKSF